MRRGAPYFPYSVGSHDRDHEDDRRHRDRLLDEALKDTFPASDPPSIAMPRWIEERRQGCSLA
jgi:hypothetical protein